MADDSFSGLSIFLILANIKPVFLQNDEQISFILHDIKKEGDYIMWAYNINDNDSIVYERRNAVTFVNAENDGILHSKAIIVVGDKKDNKVREEIKIYSDLAYKALRYQGYTADNVRYLSNLDSEFSEEVNNDTSKQNLRNLITSWAAYDPKTSDLLIYFVGHGADGEFIMADNEKITAAELHNWLNELQSMSSIRVTLIYDACQSGSFVSKLKGKDRIVITSSNSDQPTYFTGDSSFSYYFWSTLAGETVRQVNLYDAFQFASEQSKSFQTSLIDANGNGRSNEIDDTEPLKAIKIGRASFNVDMNSPALISENAYINHILNGETSALLSIEVSKEDDTLKVWAIIMPPDYQPDPNNPISEYCSDTNGSNCLSKIELLRDSVYKRKYTGSYDRFTANGTYTVTFQAERYSSDSKISIFALPQYEAFTQMKGEEKRAVRSKRSSSDALLYEENDTFRQAKYIAVNYPEPQHHTFYKPKDEDWLKFNATSDKPYNIRISSMNPFCNVLIEIYDADGIKLSESRQPKDTKNPSGDKILTWTRPDDKTGVYYVRLRNAYENIFGETIKYDFEIYQPTGDFHGYLEGKAPAWSVIKTDTGGSDISDSDGNFTIVQKSGNSNVTIWVPGYKAESDIPINLLEGDTTIQNLNSRKLIECQSPTVKIVFPSSTTIIDKGESVNFQGTVTGGKSPYQYFWYFGGAPNSDKQNPGNVVFDKPDNPDDVNIFYPVLYVKDADGCVGKSQPVTVKVNYVAPQPEEDSGGGGCFIRSVFYDVLTF